MSKFMVTVTVPEGLSAGDTFEVEVETPVKESKPRGQLAGLTLEEMDLAQLKREKINAGSVLYKAKQRGAAEATIQKNQERLDAVMAEIAKRTPSKEAGADKVAEALGGMEDETVYTEVDEEAAAEM